jgi:hypothetical protein
MGGKAAEKGVHKTLESSGSVFQTERQSEDLRKAKLSNYRHLWNFIFGHGNLLISLVEIKFGVEMRGYILDIW